MAKATKLLITGCSGQVGRFLIRKLISERIDFSGLDINFNTNMPDIDFFEIDLTKKSQLKGIKTRLEEYNTVFHLASYIDNYQDVTKHGTSSIDLNIMGTLNLLEFLPNVEHFCFASSYMVYGNPNSNLVSEEHNTEPANIYGSSKLIMEKFLQVYAKNKCINLGILRFMGIYGLENPYAFQAITEFIKAVEQNRSPIIYGDGKTRRNHIHIDDVVNAFLAWLKKKNNGVFNIGGPEVHNNLDLVNLINQCMKKKIEITFKDSEQKQHDFISDISKAQKNLDFFPTIGIKDGIRKAINTRIQTEKNHV